MRELDGDQLPKPAFTEAMDDAERDSATVVEKSGWHKPKRKKETTRRLMMGGGHTRGCGCTLTTPKGAHRDVEVAYDDYTVYYLHQSPICVWDSERRTFRLDSCGYETRLTKGRLNACLPYGYEIRQRDHDWYLHATHPNAETDMVLEFEDGMQIKIK